MQAPSSTPSADRERSRSAKSSANSDDDDDGSDPRVRQMRQTPPRFKQPSWRTPSPRDSTPLDRRTPVRSPRQPLPSSPLPPLLVVPDILPGTNLTYKTAFELFKWPTAFGVTPMNTVAYNRELQDLIDWVGAMSQIYFTRVKGGTFNAFYEFVDDDDEDRVLATAKYTPELMEQIKFSEAGVGVRRSRHIVINDETSYNTRIEADWDETFLTIVAALAGIGPRVLAAGHTSKEYILVLERGHSDLANLFRKNAWGPSGPPVSYSSKLATLMRISGQLKLVLTDMKTGNMILIKGQDSSGSDDRLCFIDFDSKSAVIVESANAECVEFINIFLFMSFVYHYHMTNAMAMATTAIRERLETLLLQFRNPNDASTQTFELSLCGILLTLARKDERKYTGLLRLVRSDSRLLARYILNQCGHYLKWRQGPSSRIPAFDDSENAPPIIEQIARRALDNFDILDATP